MKYKPVRLVVLIVPFALLGLRAYLTGGFFDTLGNQVINVSRTVLPVIVTLALLLLTGQGILNPKHQLYLRIADNSFLMSVLTLVIAVLLVGLDVLAGFSPYLLLAGMAVYGTLAWIRPVRLVLSSLAVTGSIAALMILNGDRITIEVISIFSVSFSLALFTAHIVRKNIKPSEERLQSLEAENKELWNLSYRDGLTGLYNRRYLEQVAEHLFSRAVRYREPLHVLMLDIDHFKKVNDKLGHQVGDEVIQSVSATIQSIIRTSDTVARYGGEEFIAFLVQSNSEITQFIANRIRDGIASTQFPDVPWQVTISIGVAGLQDGDTVDSLIDRADQFLYASKHHGRNRVSGF
jgi:diguanylate cyclase (GGDEF)-like protein